VAGIHPESEKDFSSWFLDYAHLCGWEATHFRPAWTEKGWRTPVMGDGAGFPDWFLMKPRIRKERRIAKRRRFMLVELKGTGGNLTGEQADKLETAKESGIPAYCFWPDQREEIEEILRGGS